MEWIIFKTKCLHLIHLHVTSRLSKIDELRYIARLINAAVIGISDSRVDKSITDSEIIIVMVYYVLTETKVGLLAILETTYTKGSIP